MFNLQGAIFAFLCRESLFIISCRFHLVKNFFNFFEVFSTSQIVFMFFSKLFQHVCCPLRHLIQYITQNAVCQQLFSFVFKLFISRRRSLEATWLVYDRELTLSTLFFCFLSFLFRLWECWILNARFSRTVFTFVGLHYL